MPKKLGTSVVNKPTKQKLSEYNSKWNHKGQSQRMYSAVNLLFQHFYLDPTIFKKLKEEV